MSDNSLGVILTAGKGTRLAPLTPETPKPLIPLLNRPLLAYALDLMSDLGLSETVVVVGAGDDATVRAARAAAPPNLAVHIATQAEPRGSGDALASAGDLLDGRATIVLAVDTVLLGDVRAAYDAFGRSPAVAGLLLSPVERPEAFGVAVLEGNRIIDLVEKPEKPRSNLANVGLWMLRPAAVRRVCLAPATNAKGESDLTATLAALVGEGADVRGWVLNGEWLDAGSVANLLSAQMRLLALRDRDVIMAPGAVAENCDLAGVVVGEGATLRGVSLSRALIAPGATLEGGSHEDVVVTASGEVISA